MFDVLDEWERNVNRWFARKAYEAQTDMHSMVGWMRPAKPLRIIAVRARCYDERRDRAHAFTKYASHVHPLRHANYVIARTEGPIDAPGVVGSWDARPVCEPGLIDRVPFPQRVKTCGAPEAPYHLEQIGVPRAHQVSTGNGIGVAVIDTGADETHPELHGKVIEGYDFVNDRPGCKDDNGHGTHVSGLVCGTVVGAAPRAHLYVAKVLDMYGSGNEAGVAMGIDWALEKDISIISMSLGSKSPSPLEEELVGAANAKRILVCAAAGNEGRGASYPAAYDGVMSVAAVDRHNEHASFSNVDPSVDISAPGVSIVSCIPGGGYAQHSGTSMATPLVSGVAALMASSGCMRLEARIEESAQKLGAHNSFGAGLIRADSALDILHKNYNARRPARAYGG